MKLFHHENRTNIYIFFSFYFIYNLQNLNAAQSIFQHYANPIYHIINFDQLEANFSPSSFIRSGFFSSKKTGFLSSFTSTSFYNSGHPNSENSGHLIANKYFSNYTGLSLSYINKFLFFQFQPTVKNKRLDSQYYLNTKINTHSYLNEKGFVSNNLKKYEIINSSLGVLFYNISAGFSNQEMWIGPGFHSSLSMSNNSEGFNHYFISSFDEIRFSKYGINFKYFISERDSEKGPFFHNSLSATLTYYSNPAVTIGFNRVHLSGADPSIEWNIEKALNLSFEPLFGNNKSKYSIVGEPDYWDPWDQLLVGFINFYFPLDDLHLYLEFGTDDSRANFTDLKSHWDHASGYIIGFKKYSSINDLKLFFGVEAMSTKNSTHTLNPSFFRGNILSENFYNRNNYLFSTFNGRRWAAHSGSDSDDKILMFGFVSRNYSSLLSYNYERHGITTNEFPEIKRELSLRFIYHYGRFNYGLIIEHESIKNFNFNKIDKSFISNVIGLSLSYNLTFK
tara:strand:- start:298 stop:1815 length:1518 start_codon:yes stop_codon:yes gene_type:complete